MENNKHSNLPSSSGERRPNLRANNYNNHARGAAGYSDDFVPPSLSHQRSGIPRPSKNLASDLQTIPHNSVNPTFSTAKQAANNV
jgi:hypothetical protein